jgi:serine protease Do
MVKRLLVGIVLLVLGAALGAGAYSLMGKGNKLPVALQAPHLTERGHLPNPSPASVFPSIANSVSEAVVNISTVRLVSQGRGSADDPFYDFFNDFFSPLYDFGIKKHYTEQSSGSGVIVSPEGYIITNHHVVADAERIKVTLQDKRSFNAEVIGVDTKTDLAVVRIKSENLPFISWGNSDHLRVGDFVLAVGNPFGLSHTVTMGIISAVGRANVGIAEYEDFIQTDAAINPGNSGGPLVNTRGELVGINTAIFSKSGGYQGIGFAVPSNMVRLVMEQLITGGRVVRGWMGVSIQELTPALTKAFSHSSLKGALVSETVKGSPAEKAALMHGDIILSFQGAEVEGPSELRNLVARSTPGKSAKVIVLRSGIKKTIDVVVAELPTEGEPPRIERMPERRGELFSGLSVIALTEDTARQLNLPKYATGVVVAGLIDDSPAAESGLKRGDVIHEIEGRQIEGLDDFQSAATTLSSEKSVLMYISRQGKKIYITVMAS